MILIKKPHRSSLAPIRGLIPYYENDKRGKTITFSICLGICYHLFQKQTIGDFHTQEQ